MTEKPFTRIICSNDEYTGSLYCNDEPMKIDDVCTVLNEQSETIHQLQSANGEMEDYCARLEEKVKETLQKGKDLVEDGFTARELLRIFAEELGVDLE